MVVALFPVMTFAMLAAAQVVVGEAEAAPREECRASSGGASCADDAAAQVPSASETDQDREQLGSQDFTVRPSGIPGSGLGTFARRSFAKGELLGTYKCVHVQDTVDHDTSRSWRVNSTHICDGNPIPLNNPLLYVNSICSKATCDAQNAEKSVAPDGAIIYLAKRAVAVGEELLVDYSASYFRLSPMNVTYVCNMPPLCVASATGDIATVVTLLGTPAVQPAEAQFDINAMGTDGWSALMEACAAGYDQIAEILLRRGADLMYAEPAIGQTALNAAANQGEVKVVQKLLVFAHSKGKLFVRELLRSRMPDDGATALYIAAGRNQTKVVRLLLQEEGTDVNAVTNSGATALFIAAQVNNAPCGLVASGL